MIVNHESSHLSKTAINRGPPRCCESTFKRFKALPKYKKYSKRNHSSHLPKSSSALESNLKAFKNLKRLQVSENL